MAADMPATGLGGGGGGCSKNRADLESSVVEVESVRLLGFEEALRVEASIARRRSWSKEGEVKIEGRRRVCCILVTGVSG